MAANNFFGYTTHSQATPAAGYNTGVAPPTAYPTPGAATGVAVTPSVAVAAQPPPAGSVAANQFVAQSQPTAPPPQPPQGTQFRPGTAVIAFQPQQNAVSATTYVMAPPTAAATPVVTSVYPNPTSTYHPYPPLPQSVAAAAAPAQVYDANTKTSYYAQPPVSVSSVGAPVTYALGEAAHYQARPTYSASSSHPPMSRPTQNVMRVSYTYGQPPTSSYSYPAAVTVTSANMYAINPSSTTMAPNSTTVVSNHPSYLVRGPSQQVRPVVKPPKPPPKPQQLHYCDVCKISCAGPQTYKEHLDGQKHKKKAALGTPLNTNAVPKVGNALRCELCDVTCTGSDAYAAHIRGAKHQKVIKLHTKLGKPIPSVDPVIVSANKSNIVTEETNKKSNIPKINIVSMNKVNSDKSNVSSSTNGQVNIPLLPDEKVIQPVGFDYIEEIKNTEGKVTSYSCKLCECKFNDPNAKEMHMKGRKHRLQYKKKVNPDLIVDLKPSLRQRRLAEERAKRSMAKEDFWRRRDEEFRLMEEEEKNMLWGMAPNCVPPPPPQMMIRRPDSSDDRHVIAKHGQIYPTDEQLASIQKQVSIVEKCLKAVSDGLDGNMKLKGVMRVGSLAKGLLLKADKTVDLVLLASEVPTIHFLETVASKLQVQFSNKSTDGSDFTVTCKISEARMEVKASLTVHIGLTSASVRADDVHFPEDALPKEKCLEHLAMLRHAKWFGARAAGLQSAVMIIRVLRDMQIWTPSWQPLRPFALELIVEKSLASAGLPLSPGDGLRRVFESISGGCILQGSPGLLDPCEKDAKDVLDNLTNQERENLTSHAQKSLRLIAFRQVHQVLDMEQLIPNKYTGRGKKRPHTSVGSSGNNAGALQNGGGTDEPSAKAIKHEAKDNN